MLSIVSPFRAASTLPPWRNKGETVKGENCRVDETKGWNVEKLQVRYLPLSELKPYEKNPRDNSKAVSKVEKSLTEFGWRQPLVVDKDMVIIVGHTRYQAAKNLGMNTVPVVVADDLPPEKVKAYRLADNKTSDFSIWDNKLLLEELTDLSDFDVFTGFDESEQFDRVLDENDNDPLKENESGVIWEVVFKSPDKRKLQKMIDMWSKVDVG